MLPRITQQVTNYNTVQVYSTQLLIHAEFSGLRHIMYYYPLISTCAGVYKHTHNLTYKHKHPLIHTLLHTALKLLLKELRYISKFKEVHLIFSLISNELSKNTSFLSYFCNLLYILEIHFLRQ